MGASLEANVPIFDASATGFASAIDSSISTGRYLRGKLFVEAATRQIPPGGSVLDYGCGPGRIGLMLARAGFRVLGVDPSPSMVAVASRQDTMGAAIDFRISPPQSSDFRGGPFQAIVCSSVIQYVREPEQLLEWFSGHLDASGTLIISFDNRRSLWRLWTRFRHHFTWADINRHSWTWPGFRSLLENAGFAPEGIPIYFESPFDRFLPLTRVARSSLVGTLGFIVARKVTYPIYSARGNNDGERR